MVHSHKPFHMHLTSNLIQLLETSIRNAESLTNMVQCALPFLHVNVIPFKCSFPPVEGFCIVSMEVEKLMNLMEFQIANFYRRDFHELLFRFVDGGQNFVHLMFVFFVQTFRGFLQERECHLYRFEKDFLGGRSHYYE